MYSNEIEIEKITQTPGLFVYFAHDELNSTNIKTVNKLIWETSCFLTAPKHFSSKLHVTAQASRVKQRQNKARPQVIYLTFSAYFHLTVFNFSCGWIILTLNIWNGTFVTILLCSLHCSRHTQSRVSEKKHTQWWKDEQKNISPSMPMTV